MIQREIDRILFQDESMIRDYQALAHTWFPKGQQKIIPTYGKHRGVKLIGTLDYESGEVFCIEKEQYDANVFLAFLKQVVARYPGEKIVMVLDNARIHHAIGVLWQLNMKEKLNEKGIDFDTDYYILEVCNPHEAKRVLSVSPMVGYFLPCKITVYVEDGRTRIGLPKPTALNEIVGGENLQSIAEDVEQRLIAFINKVALLHK